MRSAFEPIGQKPTKQSEFVGVIPGAIAGSVKPGIGTAAAKQSNPNETVRRDSGVVVSLGIAEALARANSGPIKYDADGRRQVIVEERLRREIVHLVNALAVHGLSLHIVCDRPKPDSTRNCHSPMNVIGEGTRDAGLACHCQRIYFR